MGVSERFRKRKFVITGERLLECDKPCSESKNNLWTMVQVDGVRSVPPSRSFPVCLGGAPRQKGFIPNSLTDNWSKNRVCVTIAERRGLKLVVKD